LSDKHVYTFLAFGLLNVVDLPRHFFGHQLALQNVRKIGIMCPLFRFDEVDADDLFEIDLRSWGVFFVN